MKNNQAYTCVNFVAVQCKGQLHMQQHTHGYQPIKINMVTLNSPIKGHGTHVRMLSHQEF